MNFLTRIYTIAAIIFMAGCASNSTQQPTVSASDTCAPDETLVCEVSNTGRIKHGSFSKEGKRCSCSNQTRSVPIIPGIP